MYQLSLLNWNAFFHLMLDLSLEGICLHKIQVGQAEVTTHFRYPTSKAQTALLASLLGAVERTKDPLEYILVLQRQGIDSQATYPLGPMPFLHSKVSMPKTIELCQSTKIKFPCKVEIIFKDWRESYLF